jgi:hypothetical protein
MLTQIPPRFPVSEPPRTIVIGGRLPAGRFTKPICPRRKSRPRDAGAERAIQMSFGCPPPPSSDLYMERHAPGLRGRPITWAIPKTCSHYNLYKVRLQVFSRNPHMGGGPGPADQGPVFAAPGHVTCSGGTTPSRTARRSVGPGLPGGAPGTLAPGARPDLSEVPPGPFLRAGGSRACTRLPVVQGVGHDSQGMFTSASGLSRLFGTRGLDNQPPPTTTRSPASRL